MADYPFRPRFGEPLWGPGSGWTRRWRDDRAARQLTLAGDRLAERLGPQWNVVDWQALLPPATQRADMLPGYLVIGPGGVFCVGVVWHGRSKVLMAGDVVQINGRRPRFVAWMRRDAGRVGQALSGAVGYRLNVFAVLAFAGRGMVSVNGVPKNCMITTYRELESLLAATGQRITSETAVKLTFIARSPRTWGAAEAGESA
jgi:hypothetical protein